MERKGTFLFLFFFAVNVLCATSACQSEDDACPQIDGKFLALHEQVEGTCPPLPSTYYELQNENTKTTVFESDLGGTIVTDIDRMGCTLGVSKLRLDLTEKPLWQMVGTLDVDNAKRVTGMMTRYEWSDEGQIVCSGRYSTTMTKSEIQAF